MRRSPLIAVLLCSAPACSRHGAGEAPSPSTAPSAAVSTPSASARSAPAPSASSEPGAASNGVALLAPTTACRAIAVKGHVSTADGRPLVQGAVLGGSTWLDLDPGASVAVKHAETSRELVFTGKGRVLPCERGEERFLLPFGQVATTTWAGARPGAEVLVATPYGAVRYGDARLDIRVDEHGVTISSQAGDAWLFAGGSEEKVAAGAHAERRGPSPNVKALVGECEKGAAEAEKRARAVLMPGAGAAPLGMRAAEHVRARRAARAACAIASAALGGGALGAQNKGNEQESDDLGRRVAYADARWRSVPPQVDPTQKVESR